LDCLWKRHADLIYCSFSWRGFLEVRELENRVLVAGSLERQDEWFTYCMAARGHITQSCAPKTFTVKRRTSCNPGPKSVMQRGWQMRRRISYYPRDLEENSSSGPILYSRMCVNMRMTPLTRIIRWCRNDAAEKSHYEARCAV